MKGEVMSINEADKPTVTSMPEENVERQLASLPQTQQPIPGQTVNAEGASDAVAPAVVLADIKPGHEIAAGATASDYAEGAASSNGNQASDTATTSDNAPNATAYSTSYQIQPHPQADNAAGNGQDNSHNLLISSYINNAVNESQRQRIIHIVEDWVNNGNCDKAKLQEALQAETVKDSMHLLEIAVEVMSRLYKSNVIGAVFDRKPGVIGIRAGSSTGNMQQMIRLMGMEDGSVRLSYLKSDGSPAQKSEDVFPDTPDTDAEVVVQAAMNWLVTKTF